MYITLYGSSVEFHRGFVGMLALDTDTVSETSVGARDSILISGVVWAWVVGYSG